MNTQPDPPIENPVRPFYWSVRRELWENRSVYIAPLVVAAVVLFATAINTTRLPRRIRTAEPAKRHAVIVTPFSLAPAPIMMATLLVGFFYCLDALYGERRDRSILFWKSLPVSDRTTVLSKASIPMVVLPLIALGLSVVTQFLLLQLGSLILMGNGMSPGTLWGEFGFFQGLPIMVYGLTIHALWFAPIYGWLLLVSAWARRAPVLWALFPPLAIAAVEKIVFNTTLFMNMLGYRMTGAMREGFVLRGKHVDVERFSQLDPARFLSAPGLWVGLIFAALCLAAAVRLRRNREPI
ncbi:MAG TPA: ABC transporter permease [Thermoanaerobaculia bacterium]|nr:ABC transporter permease [Thermoanaerobaculia bacterium]